MKTATSLIIALLVFSSCGNKNYNDAVLLPVKLGKKIGYINLSGKVVIPPQFDGGELFYDGLAVVEQNNKYGYIDKTGRLIIPAIFDAAVHFEKGFARIGIKDTTKNSPEDWPYFNSRPDLIWGLINITGEYILKPKYKFNDNGILTFIENHLMGLINIDGKIIIPATYDNISFIGNGLYSVLKNDRLGLIDTLGNTITPLTYEEIDYFNDDLAAVKINGKWGFIDKTGKMVINPIYRETHGFYLNHTAVNYNGKWGLIGKNGSFVIKPKYNDLFLCHDTLCTFKQNNHWGCIDLIGNIIIKPIYDDLVVFNGELATVSYKGLQGIINKSDSFIVAPKYENAWIFYDSLLCLCDNNKWTIKDINNQSIFVDSLDFIISVPSFTPTDTTHKYLCLRKNGKKGLMNPAGHLILPIEFDNIYHIKGNILAAHTKTNIIYYDNLGKKIFTSDR